MASRNGAIMHRERSRWASNNNGMRIRYLTPEHALAALPLPDPVVEPVREFVPSPKFADLALRAASDELAWEQAPPSEKGPLRKAKGVSMAALMGGRGPLKQKAAALAWARLKVRGVEQS